MLNIPDCCNNAFQCLSLPVKTTLHQLLGLASPYIGFVRNFPSFTFSICNSRNIGYAYRKIYSRICGHFIWLVSPFNFSLLYLAHSPFIVFMNWSPTAQFPCTACVYNCFYFTLIPHPRTILSSWGWLKPLFIAHTNAQFFCGNSQQFHLPHLRFTPKPLLNLHWTSILALALFHFHRFFRFKWIVYFAYLSTLI